MRMTRTTTGSEEQKSKTADEEDFIDNPQWGKKQRHGGAYL
jgi:hypothetical protein